MAHPRPTFAHTIPLTMTPLQTLFRSAGGNLFRLALFASLILLPVLGRTQTATHAVPITITNTLPNPSLAQAITIPNAQALLNLVCQPATGPVQCDLNETHTYGLINVLTWNTSVTPATVSSNWYSFHPKSSYAVHWTQEDLTTRSRLYGARTLVLMMIQLNVPINNYQGTYTISENKRVVENVQSLQGLISLAGLGTSEKALELINGDNGCDPACNRFGSAIVPLSFGAADLTIKSSIAPPTAANDAPPFSLADYKVTNEAKQFWDLSVAIPIKKVSELQLNSVNNTVAPTSVNRQNAFAVLNVFPLQRDLVGAAPSFIPKVLLGVSLSSQPLHTLLAGLGMGFSYGDFYAGAILQKSQDVAGLAAGSTATPAQLAAATTYSYKPQFSVGINISVKSALNALKKN